MTFTAETLETIEKHANALKAARAAASEGSVSIGALNTARQNYDDVSQPETLLSLIAEVRRLQADEERIQKAATLYDQLMDSVQGCTDGGCLIRKPQGMHTNGGCRCNRDSMKTQRVLYAAKQLRAAIDAAMETR